MLSSQVLMIFVGENLIFFHVSGVRQSFNGVIFKEENDWGGGSYERVDMALICVGAGLALLISHRKDKRCHGRATQCVDDAKKSHKLQC